jgi:hypothetical protein
MSVQEYYENTLISRLFKFDDIREEYLPNLSGFIKEAIKNKILPHDIKPDADFNSVARCIISSFQEHIEYLETLSALGLNRYKNFLKNDFRYAIMVLEHVCPSGNIISNGYLKVLKTEYENALPMLDC